MRRRLWQIACLIAPSAAIVVLAAPAHAATPVDYAALGDSYSSGVGTNTTSGSCLRSPQSYAQLWVNSHQVSSFQFAACSGATTNDVLANQLSVLNADTDLVSITIGGNDAGFADTVTTCQLASDASCRSTVDSGTAFVNNTLPGRLDVTYAAIRSHAPNARVVVLGYPHLFELNSSCGLLGMDVTKRTILNQAADAIATVTAARAAAAGFTYVDVRSRFSGHGVCTTGTAWVNGVVITNLTNSFHPTAAGYSGGYLPALDSVTG